MRVLILAAIITLVFLAGCSSPSQLSRQTLSLNQAASFESGGYAFDVSISHLDVKDNNQTIDVSITVVNNGNQGTTLAVYPALVDPVGEEYPGSEIFFSQIAPGRTVTQSGTIPLPAGAYDTLRQNALLHVRFQGATAVPYEAYWSVDFTNLP